MKTKLYNYLVNRVPGIAYRYHKSHDGAAGAAKVFSWVYLLWLNFCYHILFCRFLGRRPDVEYYESKRLPTRTSESALYAKENPNLSVKAFVDKLRGYDVVSFDVFDTLIFRPFAQPTDVFYTIGEKMGILDFKNIRAWAEWDARIKCNQKHGHMEITLSDIWENLAEDVGCDAAEGMRIEQESELALCYANPFMLEVWKQLAAMGKRIVIVSDMYLPEACIREMVERNGFTGAENIYVSCEYHKNKASGTLFKLVKQELGDVSVIHVGDNPHSDQEMAKKYGFDICPYPNVNHSVMMYRPFDMSPMVGSAYRGLVSNHLYNGLNRYSIEYEYGYTYGGLFVLGYCQFIHEYCEKNHVDQVLFLARDGDILKQVYDRLYPNQDTAYVYWSRKAATKLMADEDKHDYFRRFIYHKVNQKYTIQEILHSMELDFLVEQLGDWKGIWLERTRRQETDSKTLALKQLKEDESAGRHRARILAEIEKNFSEPELEKLRRKTFVDLRPEDELTDKNGYLLRRFIEAKWDQVLAAYSAQQTAAKAYYSEVLAGRSHAVAVDIGWAGSGAMALSHLAEQCWNIPCWITGIIAGTNTIHNAEPDASEPFLQSGKLVSYLFSQSMNRDLMKKHDLNKDYNVFWELLLSSPTRQFEGFTLNETGEVQLNFGKYDKNLDGIREIQRGISNFVQQYCERFAAFPYLFQISGRDAYAPMLVAASYNEKYLKAIEKLFHLQINVN